MIRLSSASKVLAPALRVEAEATATPARATTRALEQASADLQEIAETGVTPALRLLAKRVPFFGKAPATAVAPAIPSR